MKTIVSLAVTASVAAMLATAAHAKDLSDISVGERACWAGLTYNLYGRVVAKDYARDAVELRLDNGDYRVVPASEISGVGFCRVTDEIQEEVADQLMEAIFDSLFSSSDKE